MQNIVSEYKVLAGMFEPSNFEKIHKLPDHLFTEERIHVLNAMRKAYTEYGYITPEATEQFYKPLPSEVFAATIHQIDPLLDELRKLSKRRKLYNTGQMLIHESTKDDPLMKDIDLEQLYESEYDTTMTLAGTQLLGETVQKRNGEYHYISTGFDFLDAMMGGEWERRAISILMADPGTGKTALACDSILSMGNNGIQSLLFSFEMSKTSLLARMAANYGNIEFDKIKMGELNDQEFEHFQNTINTINKLPFHTIENTNLTIHEIVSVIRQYAKKGVKVVFIDHLQIIKLISDDKNRELGEITKRLKNISKKHDIHICILSQKNGKDGVWQIRDSGDVPANVDIIIDMVNQSDSNDDIKSIEINFTKNRNGATGKAPLLYEGPYLRFRK